MRDCIDEKLAAALYDVPVPERLAERLLDRLKNVELAKENEERPVPRSRFPARTFSRKWFWAGSGLAAVAAALLLAVWVGFNESEKFSEQFVLNEAIRSFAVEADRPGPLLIEKPAPAAYPFSLGVVQDRRAKWRPLVGTMFLGRHGVVYDMPGPAGTSAALYVIGGATVDGLAATPALHPFTTGGCCASAWQEGGLLYVLVVKGDPATYRAFLNLPQGPVV